jgi:hypothetical protein
MKITKEVQLTEMVDFEITASDVIEMLNELEGESRDYNYRQIIQTCLVILRKVPDSVIDKLGDIPCKNVVNCMQEQIVRYQSMKD